MKCFHLVIGPSGEAASPLHFVDRSDASRYQKILLLPWEPLGYFQAVSGEKTTLSALSLRVEPVSIPACYDADLDWVLWKVEGILGYVPMVPGRCFDLSSWRTISDHDMKDPVMAPKVAHAERELDSINN